MSSRLYPKGENPGVPSKGQQSTPSRKAPGHEKRMRDHAKNIRGDPEFHEPSVEQRKGHKKATKMRLSKMAKKYEKKRLEREARQDEQSKPRYHRKGGQIGRSNRYNPRHHKDAETRRAYAAQPGTGRSYREVINWKVGRAEDALRKATTPKEKAEAQRSLKTWQNHLQRQADINPATGESKKKKAEENTMNSYERIYNMLLEAADEEPQPKLSSAEKKMTPAQVVASNIRKQGGKAAVSKKRNVAAGDDVDDRHRDNMSHWDSEPDEGDDNDSRDADIQDYIHYKNKLGQDISNDPHVRDYLKRQKGKQNK